MKFNYRQPQTCKAANETEQQATSDLNERPSILILKTIILKIYNYYALSLGNSSRLSVIIPAPTPLRLIRIQLRIRTSTLVGSD